MTYRAVTHIALIVTPLRQAEEFYRNLFALEVAFREAETTEGWYTLPSDAGWDDAEASGITLGLCSLHRDAFTLALEEGWSSGGGRLSHLGVQVDAKDLPRLRTVAPTIGCQIVQDGETILVFDDPYGVRWEMTTSSYEDPRRLSTGARLGHWLTIDRSSERLDGAPEAHAVMATSIIGSRDRDPIDVAVAREYRKAHARVKGD